MFQAPVAAAYYRIYTTCSLLLPPNHTTKTCAVNDDEPIKSAA